jgi:DMSO/TMAO reductase YedYZ molybdopterin-dependent catalytic subunit
MRRRPSLLLGALLGGLTGLPLMALWFLGEQLAGLPFLPFSIFDWLARTLPGGVITLGIDTMVRVIDTLNLGSTSTTAKLTEQLMAMGIVLGGCVVLGVIMAWVLGVSSWKGWQVGAAAGTVAFIPVIVVASALGIMSAQALVWLAVTIFGWAVILGSVLETQATPTEITDEVRTARRRALISIVGGSAAIALGAWGLGQILSGREQTTGAGQPLGDLATATPETSATPLPAETEVAQASTPGLEAATSNPTATATMRDRVEPAPGTRPEVTPNEDFYRIDIDTRPVSIDGGSWVLEVEGLFDNPRPLTLSDIMAYPQVTQAITLSCISNPIGGDLIGTSNWTGVRLRDVLRDLGLRPEAQELSIEAADGFFESVAMEDLMDPRTLLVYGMNDETLPVEHGFPLRIYIPNRYGMKQPKWITRIEAIDEEGPGYWVERGWSAEARPRIISIIDTVAVDQAVDEKIPIGGIAWAGDRGIQKVEVQVDDGEWIAAILRTPPLSPLTWVQWRYDWPMIPGSHQFRVRATDGTGTLQIEERSDAHPDGATGYHMVRADV